jgi:hypothetical protein
MVASEFPYGCYTKSITYALAWGMQYTGQKRNDKAPSPQLLPLEGGGKKVGEKCKEETNMKNTIAKKGAYIGAGAGLVLFALFGLLPGSLLGGAAGINVAGWLFGLPLEPGLISRAIVLVSMLVGVLVAGIVIVTATTTIGWLAGRAIDGSVAHDQKEAAAHK